MLLKSNFIKERKFIEHEQNLQKIDILYYIGKLLDLIFTYTQPLCFGFFISRCFFNPISTITSITMFVFFITKIIKDYNKYNLKNLLFNKIYNLVSLFFFIIFIFDHIIYFRKFIYQILQINFYIHTKNYLLNNFIKIGLVYHSVFLILIIFSVLLLFLSRSRNEIRCDLLTFKFFLFMIICLQFGFSLIILFYDLYLFMVLKMFTFYGIANFFACMSYLLNNKYTINTLYKEIIRSVFVVLILQKIFFEFSGVILSIKDDFLYQIFTKDHYNINK